jgi:outer membrane protein assembly factor BamD
MKILALWLALAALLLSACSSNPDRKSTKNKSLDAGINARTVERRRELTLEAEGLYRLARQSLESSDFSAAIERYDAISTRFPFTEYATQSELEKIYALYRSFEPDKALSAAERFIREHPRHGSVDYVVYLKGLINFTRDDSPFNTLIGNQSKTDVGSFRRAFDDFALLIQKYPKSIYAGDAYQRMVFARNRLADHEMHVVDFYVRRGAYVAAAKRAEQIVAQYPGTPASYRALENLVKCYELAELPLLAKDARRLLEGQKPAEEPVQQSSLASYMIAQAPPATMSDAAPAPTAAKTEHKGFFAHVADFFSPLDSSRPDAGIEIVIPTGSKPAETTAPAAQVAAQTPESTEESSKGSGLRVYMEPYDDEASNATTQPADGAAAR